MSALLAELLAEFHRRRALGEPVIPEHYRERAGESYEDFLRIVAQESLHDGPAEGGSGERRLPRRFGGYVLLREIGRGAVGVVYEAIQRTTARPVALKILRSGLDLQPVALERFRREGEAAAAFHHPHIVDVFEAGAAEGRPYVAMELLRGEGLDAKGRWPEAYALAAAFAPVADALAALHERGIIHRDIKPANLIATADGRIVLADFGLAHVVSAPALTVTGEALGTPRYMSPEQLLGEREKVDGRSDIYGVGATLYEVASGVPLFVTTDPRELMRKMLTERPLLLSDLDPRIPLGLARIVGKALEKRPEDRYATAAALRDDLLAFAEGGAVEGRPVSRARHVARRARGLRLGALIVLLLLATFSLWMGTRPAHLHLVAQPEARVLLDGVEMGETPLRLRVPAGPHRVAFLRKGFATVLRTAEVAAREVRTMTVLLLLREDAPFPELAEGLGIELVRFDGARDRSPGAPPWTVLPIWPRGNVTLQEATQCRIEVSPAYEPNGSLEFRQGERLLWAQPYLPRTTTVEMPLPAEALQALEAGGPGTQLTWGYRPDDSRLAPSLATFTRIEAPIFPPTAGLSESTRDALRAHALFRAGSHLAAYRLSLRLLNDDPAALHLWAVRRASLLAMGLEESGPWQEMLVAIPANAADGE